MQLHYQALFNYGTKYSRDGELVKDTIQELFIGLWVRKENLNTDVNPRAYLLASLRRALHRKIQSEKRFLKAEYDQDDFLNFDFELSIEEKIIEKESDRILAKKMAVLISSLPKRQKEVIYLKFFLGLTRDEIALIMGNKPQTVSNLLQLAFKALRLEINETSMSMLTHTFIVLGLLSSGYVN